MKTLLVVNQPSSNLTMNPIRFSAFDITRQVFYKSSLSVGLVNLKPIVENRLPREMLDP